ncbi:hypothetical protein [Paenibacillus urinalis]|uniref:50S ribosomal protein L36 n=1 Tax=Paenibacillus urinalis TaxID=521520 RepID=A0AAX3N515_9BACL|nr:hypothetical protein [Paenibacillus urinalis]WDH84921.1 hypothetical protein PUW23_12210 [Paenibacillus urinalis]WDI04605.1 hypothetical protein PUW25_11890 [Paenibacillus urinalis]
MNEMVKEFLKRKKIKVVVLKPGEKALVVCKHRCHHKDHNKHKRS